MSITDLYQEADDCRRKALSYLGRPEAPFLLHLAREFERIGEVRRARPGSDRVDGPAGREAGGGSPNERE